METRYPTVVKTVLILLSSLFVFSAQSAKAQCNYTAGGNGVSLFATSPVVINGDMSDWVSYLNDADNNTYDNGPDADAPIADAGRDIVRMTSTQNLTNFIIYLERAGSTNNSVDIIVYLDINNNDLMEINEPVIHLNWSGANGKVQGRILNYIPSATLLLNSLSSNLDGKSLGGTLTPRTTFVDLGFGSADGRALEASIPFTLLTQTNLLGGTINQLQPGQNFKFHISTINGNISSVPGVNSINDNFGGCIIAPVFNSSLPLTLLNFDAILKTEKVNLNWSTTNHKDFSHFTLQRSTDGKNFKDVMVLMTDVTDFSTVHQYAYKDDIAGVNANVIYYRLQMVDADSKFIYSPVRMVRLNAVTAVQIQAFPNPVTTELRVTIPISWQEKNVTYEIYNSNGSLLSRVQKNNAVQIQQLNVSSLGSGNYIIRVTNGQEMSTTKFIKH